MVFNEDYPRVKEVFEAICCLLTLAHNKLMFMQNVFNYSCRRFFYQTGWSENCHAAGLSPHLELVLHRWDFVEKIHSRNRQMTVAQGFLNK